MEKQDFIQFLSNSNDKLVELKAIEYDGLESHIVELEGLVNEFRNGGEKLLSDSDTLQIGVVGQMKAGKSSFLNSLFFNGEDILPKAATPMTAGLTILEYSEDNVFEVEYFSNEEWTLFKKQSEEYIRIEKECRANNPDKKEEAIIKEMKKRVSESVASAYEMVSSCSLNASNKRGTKETVPFQSINSLKNVLKQYVGKGGEYTSVVKSLYIKMNDDRLKGLRIVDTPGVNDPVVSRENRTRTFLHSCHGVFLLSSAESFMESQDVTFLNNRVGLQGVAKVIVLCSKFDIALQMIGGDAIMKGIPSPSLASAIDNAKQKLLVKRYKEVLPTICDNLRHGIKCNYTCGIGFSIAKKSETEWDKFEIQTVNQMKRFFANDFSPEERMRNTFLELANLDIIRDSYLQNEFVGNKEVIIKNKISEYLHNNKQELCRVLSEKVCYFNDHLEQLKDASIEELERIKKGQKQLFDNLKTQFENVFLQFITTLQHEVLGMKVNVTFEEVRVIPTESTVGPVTYAGRLYGHNTKDFSYNQIDILSLQNCSKKVIESYITDIQKKWTKFFDDNRKLLREQLTHLIFEFEKEAKTTSFNNKFYINIVDQTLDKLKLNDRLVIDKLKYIRKSDKACNSQYYPHDTEDLAKKEVEFELKKQLEEHKEALLDSLQNVSDTMIEDINKEVNKQLESALTTIAGMKDNFASELKSNSKDYVEKLEKELSEKKETEENLTSILNCLRALNELFQ